MRYDKTSRLGVIKTDSIITEKIGWIFREQPISDVGLDAIIEEVKDDEPTGKFIAIQIKTGKGNFYCTEKRLVYYVSKIHYNYWLNLCIPIILVAYLPEENITYWQEIKESNFKKSQKRWKIEIDRTQKFSEQSKSKLIKILSNRNDKKFDIYNGVVEAENDFDIIEKISCIKDATKSLVNLSNIMNEQTEKTNDLNQKIHSYIEQKLTSESPQVISSWKAFSRSLNIISVRLENEISIFSQMYSEGIFAFEKIIIKLKTYGITHKELNIDISKIKELPNEIDYVLIMVKNLRDSVISLGVSYKDFKESKKQYIEVIELIIFEIKTAKEITENLIDNI